MSSIGKVVGKWRLSICPYLGKLKTFIPCALTILSASTLGKYWHLHYRRLPIAGP